MPNVEKTQLGMITHGIITHTRLKKKQTEQNTEAATMPPRYVGVPGLTI